MKHKVPLESVLPEVKETLLRENIAFELKNDGYHVIIRIENHRADFWPTSGKYMIDKSMNVKNGGLKYLLEELFELIAHNNTNDDIEDSTIFQKDINDMDKLELIDTIHFLCDYINGFNKK